MKTHKCEQCGEDFNPTPRQRGLACSGYRLYCSEKCRNRWKNARKNEKRKRDRRKPSMVEAGEWRKKPRQKHVVQPDGMTNEIREVLTQYAVRIELAFHSGNLELAELIFNQALEEYPTLMQGVKAKLDDSVEVLGITVRQQNALQQYGIDTVEDLLRTPRDQVFAIANVNVKTWDFLAEKLRKHGWDHGITEIGIKNAEERGFRIDT